MQKTYIVIGTSAAGMGCAVKLKALDPAANIICLTDQQELPYNRCLLADYLSGHKSADQIITKPEQFFIDNEITLMRNARVVSIDRERRQVSLQTGQQLTYDKLFLGMGRSGWIPELPGSSLKGVFPFYGLADTRKILAYIKEHRVKHAVVVGAGLSGLECADSLATQGLSIDIIERSAHALPSQLDSDGGAFLQNIMQQHKVTTHTAMQVQEIGGQNNLVSSILLSNNTVIKTEIVIFAIGGRINSDSAKNCGLTLHNNGLVTSSQMQTNDPNIFAGGDVCAVKDQLTGQLVQSCLWPDAVMQGMAAAYSMVGQERHYQGTLIITSSHIYGTTFVTCGPIPNPPDHYQQIVKTGPDYYHKFLVHNNQLKGFAMIGNVNNVGILRKKILDGSEFQI